MAKDNAATDTRTLLCVMKDLIKVWALKELVERSGFDIIMD